MVSGVRDARERGRDMEGTVRTGQRTALCKQCGKRGEKGDGVDALYWHRRQDKEGECAVYDGGHCWMANKHCARCGVARFVMCDEYGNEHSVKAGTCQGRQVSEPHEPSASVPNVPAETVRGDSALVTALRDALGAVEASVNPEQVRDIVQEELAQYSPSVTVVEVVNRENFESKAVGVTHAVYPKVFKMVQCGVHVWLRGPAGSGKTHLAKQIAQGLGDLPYGHVSLTQTMTDSKLLGYMDANGRLVRTVFRDIFEHGGVFLFDECDNGNPNVLNVLNAALANGTMAFPDGMVSKHANCYIIAAANTFGTGADSQYVGRMQLDGAFMNRFRKVPMPIDEHMEETLMLSYGANEADARAHLARVRQIRAKAEELKIKVVISPRNAIDGAKLLAAGFSLQEVEEITLRDEMPQADWERVNRGY